MVWYRVIILLLWKYSSRVNCNNPKLCINFDVKLKYRVISDIPTFCASMDTFMIRYGFFYADIAEEVKIHCYWHFLWNILFAETSLFDFRVCTQRWTLQGIAKMQIFQWKACSYCKYISYSNIPSFPLPICCYLWITKFHSDWQINVYFVIEAVCCIIGPSPYILPWKACNT